MIRDSLVSVIIVNYNGETLLKRCVEAVLQNKYPNFEIIVIDNGSKDGSPLCLKELEKQHSNVRVILLDKNYGPAYARNRGAEKANGIYLAFLDNDTVPDENWLVPLVETMEKDVSVGACQCKLLLFKEPDKFDYAGDYLSQFGFLVQQVQGGEKDVGQADQKVEILSAKSAAMIIRRNVFKKIGGFDEDYFIYLEETDLGWRIWLIGYKVIFVPESKVYHEFGTTSIIDPKLQNFNAKFHGTKNYIMTLVKNLGTMNLMKILPLHILSWIGIILWMAIMKRKFYESGLILRGMFWNCSYLFAVLKKRDVIQSERKIRDKDLLPKIMKRRNFSYFYNKLVKAHKIGYAKSWSA